MKTAVGTVEKRFVVKENKVEGILNWDADNSYPQRIMYTIAASGTATSCVNLYSKYIHGQGFKDQDLGKTVVNRSGQTLDKLLRKLAKDYARFKGFAVHVNYNGLLEIAEINFVPFEHCRLCIPDDAGYTSKIAVYKDWNRVESRNIDKRKLKQIHVFNPSPEIVASQIEQAGGMENYTGQVLWYSDDDKEYPACSCDSVLEDVETDAKIKVFKWRTVTTGFMASHLLVHKGKFESEQDRQDFKDNVKSFQGADNASKILTIEVETQDEVPELLPFDIVNNDKLFELTEGTVKNNIIQNYLQPLVLLSIKTPGQLGTAQEIQDAQDFYDRTTQYERAVFQGLFTNLLSNWKDVLPDDLTIVPVGGIKAEAKEQSLATQLGVGGTQSIITILQSAIDPQQKINVMQVVFGVKKELAQAMVDGTEIVIEKS